MLLCSQGNSVVFNLEQKFHRGLVTPNANIDPSQLGTDNGLMPDGTKLLPKPMGIRYWYLKLQNYTQC